MWKKLRACGRCTHELHLVPVSIRGLMYVTPDHTSHPPITIDDREELISITQSDTVQPGATVG